MNYCTVAEANTYFGERLNCDAWFLADVVSTLADSNSAIILKDQNGNVFRITVSTEEGQTTTTAVPYVGDLSPAALDGITLREEDGSMYNITITTDLDGTHVNAVLTTTPLVYTNKEKALAMASRALDRLNWLGSKTDAAQVLQFPRGGDTAIPDDIKFACAEEALSLLEGRDPTLEYENLRTESQQYKNVKASYNTAQIAEHIVCGFTSLTAWRYIKSYLRDSRVVQISRV
jgi:hypothetical protein